MFLHIIFKLNLLSYCKAPEKIFRQANQLEIIKSHKTLRRTISDLHYMVSVQILNQILQNAKRILGPICSKFTPVKNQCPQIGLG